MPNHANELQPWISFILNRFDTSKFNRSNNHNKLKLKSDCIKFLILKFFTSSPKSTELTITIQTIQFFTHVCNHPLCNWSWGIPSADPLPPPMTDTALSTGFPVDSKTLPSTLPVVWKKYSLMNHFDVLFLLMCLKRLSFQTFSENNCIG